MLELGVMMGYSCPRCGNRKLYAVRRNKKRCKKCLYEWKPKLAGLRLKRNQWKKILFWFLLGHSIKTICQQTGISHYSVEKAVTATRRIMAKDVPGIFSGTKQPVFGILTRQGKVFAKLVEDTEAVDFLPIITKKVKTGSRICSDTWRAYTGLAAKGYVHRTIEHGEKEYARGKNHINGLEGFWGYLKRKLAAKGGVRRKYLFLFLGEYVWRYNYRNMETEKQVDRLLGKITYFSG